MSRISTGGGYWIGELEARIRPLDENVVRNRLTAAGVPQDRQDDMLPRLQALPLAMHEHMIVHEAGAPAGAVKAHAKKMKTVGLRLADLLDDPLSRLVGRLVHERAVINGNHEFNPDALYDALRIALPLLAQVEAQIAMPAQGGSRSPETDYIADHLVRLFRAYDLPIEARANGLLSQVFDEVLKSAQIEIRNPDEKLREFLNR